MCGIAGFIDLTASTSNDELKTEAKAMGNSLIRRGPDQEGVWCDQVSGVALAHRRLSILDLTESGAQPMISRHARYVISFNGEIYNYQALRTQLIAQGYYFKGTSDTEVLLGCIETHGVENTLTRLEGVFAFAVFDREEKKLVIARDRLGEKPLSYCFHGRYFWFASEVRAFKKSAVWKKYFGRINESIFPHYLSFGNIPAPYTIYQNVYKLPPGSYLEIRLDQSAHSDAVRYYRVIDSIQSGSRSPSLLNDDEATSKLEELLSGVVQRQMTMDVPYGAFLSGGIDSSTVVAMMKKNSSVPIRTFSIGFEEEGYNEANHARLVARHLQTSHTEHIVTAKQAMEVVPSLPEIYDEPFADSSQIPTFLLAQLTRKQVTVALSGDGGDELFGGYNRYLYGPGLWKRSSQYPLWMRAIPGKALLGLQPNVVRCALRILSLLYPRLQSVPLLDEKIRKLGMGLLAKSEDELYYLLQSSLLKGNFPVHRELPLIDDPVSRQQYLDLSSYLPDDILVKIDRATMAASLESRIPFLSQPIVEFAWTLPLNQKIRDGKGKWILRQLLYRHVPKELVDRPKAGFAVPLHAWLGGALQDWAHGLLQESKFEWVPKIWEEHLSGKRNHAPLLWNVLMLQGWLRNEAKEP